VIGAACDFAKRNVREGGEQSLGLGMQPTLRQGAAKTWLFIDERDLEAECAGETRHTCPPGRSRMTMRSNWIRKT